MDSLKRLFEDELVTTSIDLGIDYCEIGLDELIDNDVIREIPFVKSIAAIFKMGRTYYQRRLLKNIILFLQEFHNGDISQITKEKFLKQIEAPKIRTG